MQYTNIISTTVNGVNTILINRPKKLNALNSDTINELQVAMSRANEDKDIKIVILSGSGEKAFVAGADISEFADFDVEEGKYLAADGQHKLFDFIETLSIPVIAAVNGFALGGGLELAMACHFRIASDNAKMGLPEASLGVIPGYGGTQRLIQLVGKGRALEMMFSAKMLDSETAEKYGLINKSCDHESLMNDAIKMAKSFIKNSGDAQAAIIKVVNTTMEGGEGFKAEIKEFGERFESAEFAEGTAAFIEKRKPTF